MPNQLAQSLSPYLLQHQDNPVDWVEWSEDAFAAARARDVPIFLSIGYAACHWCHVMAHECFENKAIGRMLSDHFVCIKVDREERPDVDQIYMNAVQLMTGQGGWPMSVFLDHDGRPFFAGTYFPPSPRGNMPSLPQLLAGITEAWNDRRSEIAEHATEILEALRHLAIGTEAASAELPRASRVEVGVESLLKIVDTTWGGFGGAPKFPHATDLDLLLRFAARTGDRRAIEAVTLSLDKMAAGGIRDHIGGGFSRYSVDVRWLVPHFEKMLYDNALLAQVYTHAFQVTKRSDYADVSIEILEYLNRQMLDGGGAWHSSEDADSEGVEGKFYVWQPEEIAELLGPERGERFCKVYDITPQGNFEQASIPNLPQPITHWAEVWNIDAEPLSRELADDREKLRIARSNRIAPGRDDKIIVAWNALAIRAFAVAGQVFERSDFIQSAIRATKFILDSMRDEKGRLLHAHRAGVSRLDGLIDDYALTIDALISLHEVTGEEHWLAPAIDFAIQMIDRFEDKEAGGFFYTPSDAPALITRNKDWHDGSLVSGNGAATNALLRLAALTGNDSFRQSAINTLRCGDSVMQKQSRACSALLMGLDRVHHDADNRFLPNSSPNTSKQTKFGS